MCLSVIGPEFSGLEFGNDEERVGFRDMTIFQNLEGLFSLSISVPRYNTQVLFLTVLKICHSTFVSLALAHALPVVHNSLDNFFFVHLATKYISSRLSLKG